MATEKPYLFQPGNRGGGRPKDTPEMKKAKALLKEMSLFAVQKLIERANSSDEKISLAAANSILDRSLGKPGQMENTIESLATIDLFRRILDRVQAMPDGSVIDDSEDVSGDN